MLRDPAELAVEHAELPADVEAGGGRLAGEVPRRDEDRRVADGGRVAARLGHQVAQGADVDGGLDRGGGHLARVGLAVDDRERLDLDDVEGAVEPERDQVGLQVGVPTADPQAQQRVVEQRAAGLVGGGQHVPGVPVPTSAEELPPTSLKSV